MKKDTIIYWTTTGLISAMMLFSAYSYFTSEEIKAAFVHLGFPSWFRIELGVAKMLAAIAIVLPSIPARFKGFAYAGLAITFISAIIAHMSMGDVKGAMMPLLFLLVLAVSYFFLLRTRKLQVA